MLSSNLKIIDNEYKIFLFVSKYSINLKCPETELKVN